MPHLVERPHLDTVTHWSRNFQTLYKRPENFRLQKGNIKRVQNRGSQVLGGRQHEKSSRHIDLAPGIRALQ
jgi:hypothetical protein